MSKGIDCATPLTIGIAARVKAAGYDFVGRYLVPQSFGYKHLSAAEAKLITDAGLRILTVWESTADRVKGGYAAGVTDGQRALACAQAIHMPERGIIYFAVDYDAQPGEYETIAEYLRAARAQTGSYEIGVYGGYKVIEAMAQRGVCMGYWQCCAWSYGALSPALTVYQSDWSGTTLAIQAKNKIGISVDLNTCADMDRAGIWTYEEGLDMTIPEFLDQLTPEQAWQIIELANQHAATLPVSDWARAHCVNGIASGLFTDGNRDGLVDNPMAYVKRQELAAVCDRAGLQKKEG